MFLGRSNKRGSSGTHHNCFTKKYRSKKHRSIAFQNAGRLKGKVCEFYNVSAWDTRTLINERKHYG